ncbi:hypothetical protein RND71_019557 [Anisodus tanguticus]|uniref:Fatty acid desaturase domain-containing protein n=1 Tax=Anisodus tanguticus TaxID=243964 RepID=A0AAE1RZ98_9SOLA|nr:hypothetical protein RND71_019557 [Anisodus tanguticus]
MKKIDSGWPTIRVGVTIQVGSTGLGHFHLEATSSKCLCDYQWVNDTVGLILHSTVLTPYLSWRYTHRRHHSNTNSLEHDEVYVPRLESELRWFSKYLNNSPLGRTYNTCHKAECASNDAD